MARPLRLEFSGALYHVTSRGDRQEDIYLDDEDRLDWLGACPRTVDKTDPFNFPLAVRTIFLQFYRKMAMGALEYKRYQ